MIGLETYSATKKSFVGIDWLNLTSSAFKTAGGAFGGGGGAGGSPDAMAEAKAAQARAEEQKKAAEASASLWKKVGIGAAVVAAVGGVLIWRKKAAA